MKERVGGFGETEWINTEGTGKTEIGTLVKPRVTRRGRVGASRDPDVHPAAVALMEIEPVCRLDPP
jgi:hypothetical protein